MVMLVTLTRLGGEMNAYVDDADLASLVAELDGPEDLEHLEVSVAHESGWGSVPSQAAAASEGGGPGINAIQRAQRGHQGK